MRNSIEKILAEYESSSRPFCMIHADLHASNVVVQGSRLHIIDFDDSGFGWHAYDLAVALDHLRDSPQYTQLKSSLLDGYTDVRQIATQEIDMVELFLAVRSLASIGWISARPDLKRDSSQICQNLHDEARSRLNIFES
jgi:Ser/Thr protein kinase RdoA (MazF antagonist)